MIQLYSDQTDTVNGVRALYAQNKKRVILCSPPGSGKTVMFSYMAWEEIFAIKKKHTVLILTDRIELLTQTNGTLEQFNIEPQLFKAGSKNIPYAPVVIAMGETIKRRLNNPEIIPWLQSFNLVIVDEAHKQSFDKMLIYLTDKQYILGATATPQRKGRKSTQLNEFYDAIYENDDIPTLIEKKRLARPRYFGNEIDLSNVRIEKGEYSKIDLERVYRKLNKSLVSNYEKHIKGLKTILFASNVQNSKDARDEFIKWGYNAKHLDGTTPKKERTGISQWFKNTPNAILCNANVLTTGFDEDTIRAVIIWRATTSLPLMMQMAGRGSRYIDGIKEHFTILDFGNNIQRHGFWDAKRKWSLTHRIGNEGIAPMKFCKKCDAIINAGARVCEFCGLEMKIERKYIIAELQELTPPEITEAAKNAVEEKDWDKLEMITEARGHKKTSILYRLHGQDLIDYAAHKGYSKYYISKIINRKF